LEKLLAISSTQEKKGYSCLARCSRAAGCKVLAIRRPGNGASYLGKSIFLLLLLYIPYKAIRSIIIEEKSAVVRRPGY